MRLNDFLMEISSVWKTVSSQPHSMFTWKHISLDSVRLKLVRVLRDGSLKYRISKASTWEWILPEFRQLGLSQYLDLGFLQ